MSTATRFKYYRPFTFCFGSSYPDSEFNYYEATLEEAMALWWNLENFSIETTGSRGAVDIDWTMDFGATEVLPFTSTEDPIREGSYYDGTTPALAPVSRVCKTDREPIVFFDSELGSFTRKSIRLEIGLYASAIDGNVRVYYLFTFVSEDATDRMVIRNTNSTQEATGTPASSGTMSLLGITMAWEGGGVDRSTDIFTADTATMAATSSPFTY